MNNRLSLIGIGMSVAYLGFGAYLLRTRFDELQQLPLNNLGDFLAGAFGPLAIFWLVLGFFQQREELRLNTRALEAQAEELRNSVEQQRKLVEFTREDHHAKRLAAQPKLALQSVNAYYPSAPGTVYQARIYNFGSTATDLRLSVTPTLPKLTPREFSALAPTGALTFEFEHDSENPQSSVQLAISYTDAMDKPGKVNFILRTTWSEGRSTLEFARSEN